MFYNKGSPNLLLELPIHNKNQFHENVVHNTFYRFRSIVWHCSKCLEKQLKISNNDPSKVPIPYEIPKLDWM